MVVGQRAARKAIRRAFSALLRVTRQKRLQNVRSGQLHGAIKGSTRGRLRTQVAGLRASARARRRRRR